ncbi:MAG: MBL fold metallo-hydrolase [Deltaproteobacteria bacterium]|nr:MBL fold metallo-hydrolase [Deltaproteobacteria bacterium]
MGLVEVAVLGAGDAFGSRGQLQSGYYLKAGGFKLLMEAGPSVLAAMKREGLQPNDIDLVLISHLHGDHFAGLPFLILDYLWEKPRRRKLMVAGPRHLESRTWRLFKAMYPRSDASAVRRRLQFVVLNPETSVRLGPVEVAAMRTPHTNPDVSLAFRLSAGGKTIAYSGDTGWTERLLTLAKKTDLFLCECTYFQTRHRDFHLDYPLIEANRSKFDAGRMVLTHAGGEVLDRRRELALEIAHDGMKITA